MANDCDSCNTGTPATSKCSAKGVAICDAGYENLPTSPVLKLIGANGECLYTFEEGGANGLVFFNAANGDCTVVNDIDLDIPQLVNLIGAGPDEDVPPTFDYVMVMDGTSWRKWRGPTGTSGFIFWNDTLGVFQFGQMNENGICTEAALEIVPEGYFGVFDSALTPAELADAVTTKCVKRLVPTVPDLYYVDTDGVAHQVNPSAESGFVVYMQNDICDPELIPRVQSLCDIATPPCEDPPELLRFIGCGEDGVVAATELTPVLPEGACAFGVFSAGNATKFVNAAVGNTFYPGYNGSVRSGTAGSGNISNTILDTQITAAIGYTVPAEITHVVFYVKATLRTTAGVRRTLRVDLEGVVAAQLSAFSWDAVTEDQSEMVACIVAPVDVGGDVAFDLVHSSASLSDYDYDIQISGVFACPTIV